MKKKRYVIWAVLLIVGLEGMAQTGVPPLQRGLKGEYDVDDFPRVRFTWNSANPQRVDESRFTLTEDGKAVEFRVSTPSVVRPQKIAKNVLILWEDMASHGRQSAYTRELLMKTFAEGVFPNDETRIKVATFNRRHDSKGHVLTPLTEVFEADGAVLIDAIRGYRDSREYYEDFARQSDLYLAIGEGIEMLKKMPDNRASAIVVVTAGLNIKAAGASTEMETVRKNAVDAGIPIYVVKYPIAGDTPEVNTLAENTYGTVMIGREAGEETLGGILERMNVRMMGVDYVVEFRAGSGRDGGVHRMQMTVDKVNQPLPPYKAPRADVSEGESGKWIEDNIVAVAIGVVVLLGIVVGVAVAVRRSRKRQAEAERRMREQVADSERRNREAVERMERERRGEEEMARKERERMQMEAEEARLRETMKTKRMYPRLKCKAGGARFTQTIVNPYTRIGRDEENEVVLADETVSRYHAVIRFTGSAFEIENKSKSYQKGVVVNGQWYQRYALSSGDIIELGEAAITFYL